MPKHKLHHPELPEAQVIYIDSPVPPNYEAAGWVDDGPADDAPVESGYALAPVDSAPGEDEPSAAAPTAAPVQTAAQPQGAAAKQTRDGAAPAAPAAENKEN